MGNCSGLMFSHLLPSGEHSDCKSRFVLLSRRVEYVEKTTTAQHGQVLMASVQTGRDLPEAKWKECDVVGLLELLLQVATVKDLFLIIAVWNMRIKEVQKADSGWALLASAWSLLAWVCKAIAAQ